MTENETNTSGTTRYTADVVAVTPSRHVLLIERGWPPFEGAWALPGGHVDAGEAPYVAAARELAEETGVHVPVGALHQIGVWDQLNRDPRGHYVTFAYMVIVPDGTPVTAGDDARTARWWPLTALPDQLAFDHADIINAAVIPTP
ncbi:NUDIX hydrolase [Streptomyces sp. CJ_13]|uniref:NUDIX domain-containing protein n=1 Tax=Streptomyces sp. CJ_13 TaxID=2724943 RepID=UPI001BDC8501|nr:NUDIX hydrolase [Streptomyces sp. CJ_13]MBT1183923.1 NUDIX hydrolase [Streptomyces sp. CJ_13]